MRICVGHQVDNHRNVICVSLCIGELVKEKNGEKVLKCIETGQLYVMADPIKVRRELIERCGKDLLLNQ